MNRTEVIMTIKKAGAQFGGVMEVMCGEEYTAGYKRAISDMVELFKQAPIDANFEAERNAMLAHIKKLEQENEMLNLECGKQGATIEELLKHVDLHEVLGIGGNSKKREEPKAQRRGVAFIFK